MWPRNMTTLTAETRLQGCCFSCDSQAAFLLPLPLPLLSFHFISSRFVLSLSKITLCTHTHSQWSRVAMCRHAVRFENIKVNRLVCCCCRCCCCSPKGHKTSGKRENCFEFNTESRLGNTWHTHTHIHTHCALSVCVFVFDYCLIL